MASMSLSRVLLHGPRVLANLDSQDERSRFFVALGMGGASSIVAGAIEQRE